MGKFYSAPPRHNGKIYSKIYNNRCLRCGNIFKAASKFIRICPKCKRFNEDAQLGCAYSGSDLPATLEVGEIAELHKFVSEQFEKAAASK